MHYTQTDEKRLLWTDCRNRILPMHPVFRKEGDNLYSSTKNSGDFNGIGIDITENGDAMNTGVLEIVMCDLFFRIYRYDHDTERFRANSRIITVSDTLLEELVNLKR